MKKAYLIIIWIVLFGGVALCQESDLTKNPSYVALSQRRASLVAKLLRLQKQSSKRTPSVVNTRIEIEYLDRQLSDFRKEARILNRRKEARKEAGLFNRRKESGLPNQGLSSDVSTIIVKVQKANVRIRPEIKSRVVHQVSKGARLNVLDVFSSWFKVLTPIGKGWIHESTVTYQDKNKGLVDKNTATYQNTTIDKSPVNYRDKTIDRSNVNYQGKTIDKSTSTYQNKTIDKEIAELKDKRKKLLTKYWREYYKVKSVDAKLAELMREKIRKSNLNPESKLNTNLSETELLQKISEQNNLIINLLEMLVKKQKSSN